MSASPLSLVAVVALIVATSVPPLKNFILAKSKSALFVAAPFPKFKNPELFASFPEIDKLL